jgi:hypothetical protein
MLAQRMTLGRKLLVAVLVVIAALVLLSQVGGIADGLRELTR